MCFVFIWEQTATCATYSIKWLVFITEKKSVYSAVRTASLNKAAYRFVFKRLTYKTHQIFEIDRKRKEEISFTFKYDEVEIYGN
jgi:hypothetical protein